MISRYCNAHKCEQDLSGRFARGRNTALILSLLIALTGILVGLGSNILALFLLTFALVSAFGMSSLWADEPTSATLKLVVVAWISLQGGYMIGLTSRDYVSQLIARFGRTQSKRV